MNNIIIRYDLHDLVITKEITDRMVYTKYLILNVVVERDSFLALLFNLTDIFHCMCNLG